MKFLACACALLSAVLFSGCGMKIGMPTAEASADSIPASDSASNIDLSPTAGAESQLMHSYSHEPMADFILTNTGTRR
ncbi:MAG: hypothetical protein EOP05_19555 [Proteobacteria bacterium]|nr:MAG: hypothetical protein EOP05_19555 [Pseudomonadota bacterium]RYZ85032.1 MAG: hypothetical protein EOP06_16975 [Pseudomonadota bacterium]